MNGTATIATHALMTIVTLAKFDLAPPATEAVLIRSNNSFGPLGSPLLPSIAVIRMAMSAIKVLKLTKIASLSPSGERTLIDLAAFPSD